MDKCKVFFLNVNPLSDKILFERYFGIMSDYRQKKTLRFLKDKDRCLSLGAGILTDILLEEYGLREKNMNYAENKYGKPFFPERQDIKFNISHSGSFAMAAVSSSEVGCDIEEDKKTDTDISRLCLSENERKDDIIRIWTMKESFLKKEGCGLNRNLTELEAKKIENLYQIENIKGYWAFVCTEKPSVLTIKQVSLNSGGLL